MRSGAAFASVEEWVASEQTGRRGPPSPIILPETVRDEIEFQAEVARGDDIYTKIYNPTDFQVTGLVVRVQANATEEFPGLDRRYQWTNILIEPLQGMVRSFDASALPDLPGGSEYSVSLEGIWGRPVSAE